MFMVDLLNLLSLIDPGSFQVFDVSLSEKVINWSGQLEKGICLSILIPWDMGDIEILEGWHEGPYSSEVFEHYQVSSLILSSDLANYELGISKDSEVLYSKFFCQL